MYTQATVPAMLDATKTPIAPGCGELLIERWGFKILKDRVKAGSCPKCKTTIAGVWDEKGLEAMRVAKSVG